MREVFFDFLCSLSVVDLGRSETTVSPVFGEGEGEITIFFCMLLFRCMHLNSPAILWKGP